MKIRNVEEWDLSELAPLSCLVNRMHVEAYPDIYKEISVAAATNLLMSKLNDHSTIFRLAENNFTPIGYYFADICEIEETNRLKAFRFIYLAEIMVSPASRGSGTGKALLEDLKSIACEKNIRRIDLDVSGFNSTAHDFFKSQNFALLRNRLSAKIST